MGMVPSEVTLIGSNQQIFPDDIRRVCADCNGPTFNRPHSPPADRHICGECYIKAGSPPAMIAPNSISEIKWFLASEMGRKH